jgi:hypothetical protein
VGFKPVYSTGLANGKDAGYKMARLCLPALD